MKLTCTVTHEAVFDLEEAIKDFQVYYNNIIIDVPLDDFILGIVDDYLWPSDDIYYDNKEEDPLRAIAADILKKNVYIQLSMFDDYEE